MMCQYKFIDDNKCTILILIMEEALPVCVVAEGIWETYTFCSVLLWAWKCSKKWSPLNIYIIEKYNHRSHQIKDQKKYLFKFYHGNEIKMCLIILGLPSFFYLKSIQINMITFVKKKIPRKMTVYKIFF